MRRPRYEISINGEPAPDSVAGRLISLTVTDRAGTQSDALELELADGPLGGPEPGGFLAVPDSRAVLRVWLGYEGAPLTYLGAYTDADVTLSLLPYRLRLSASAADMKATLKGEQERSWEGLSVGAVFEALAREHGLEPAIAPSIAALRFPGDWAAMQMESVLHFGQRQAERLGAVFAVKDGKLLLTRSGAGTGASDRALEPLILTPALILKGSAEAELTARDQAGTVAAEWHDRASGARRAETVAGGGSGPRRTLRHRYADAGEARQAAAAAARRLAARADRLSVSIEGDPTAAAGRPVILDGVRPGLDGIEWLIETATHSLSKSAGFVTALRCKAKPTDATGDDPAEIATESPLDEIQTDQETDP